MTALHGHESHTLWVKIRKKQAGCPGYARTPARLGKLEIPVCGNFSAYLTWFLISDGLLGRPRF